MDLHAHFSHVFSRACVDLNAVQQFLSLNVGRLLISSEAVLMVNRNLKMMFVQKVNELRKH